ncbi:MAG: hypothetical protein E6G64_14710 [Actinobacteria bacterium]|nr:MAG: hypothetical protein E6G64_14710 [Actinomycetota bacterium]
MPRGRAGRGGRPAGPAVRVAPGRREGRRVRGPLGLVDRALAGELRDRLAKLGFEGELAHAFGDWAGNANLEERVDGVERVDPVVLAALRKQSA